MMRLFLLLMTLLATGKLLADEHDMFEFMQEYLDFAPYSDGTISSEQLNDAGLENFFFIDTRNSGQFNQGHIPGAINIDWREILKRKHEVPKDKSVVLYCETGLLSSKAQYMLQLAGYDNVKVLWGGYLVWSARQSFEEATKFGKPE